MSKIEIELQKATKIKGPKSKEDRPSYLKRLISAAQDLTDEQWEALSEATQAWVNKGANAVNDDQDPKDFPDAKKAAPDKKASASKSRARDDDDAGDDDGAADDGDADDNRAEDGDDDGDDDVAKKPAKKAAAKKPAAKKEAPAKAKPAKKGGGAQVAIKRAVIADPRASTESIAAKLEKKGLDVTPAAVSTIRSGTLQTLRLVKELGMPKGDF